MTKLKVLIMPANTKIAMVKIRSAENLSQLDTYLIK